MMKITNPPHKTNRSLTRTIFLISTQIILFSLVPIIFFQHQVFYVKLIAEDSWAEYSTFISLIFAAGLLFRLYHLSHIKKPNIWYLLLGIATLFIAMEEISWGQRIFQINTPIFIQEVNQQNEITLHNIESIRPGHLTYIFISFSFILYAFLLPILIKTSMRTRNLIEKLDFPLPSLSIAPTFLASAYFLSFSPFANAEEIGELLFGLSFASLAIEKYLENYTKQHLENRKLKTKETLIPLLFISSLFFGVLLTIFLSNIQPGKEHRSQVAKRLNQFAIERLPAAGHYKQALDIFLFLEKNPNFSRGNPYYNKGLMLQKKGDTNKAKLLFNHALSMELESLKKDSTNFKTLQSISLIHFALDNKKSSIKYLDKTFRAYDNKNLRQLALNPSKSQQPHTNNYHRHIFRASGYENTNQFINAINELLLAHQYTTRKDYKKTILDKIITNISLICDTEATTLIEEKATKLLKKTNNTNISDLCNIGN